MNSMQQRTAEVNVTIAERVLSVFTGSALLFYGLRNRDLQGIGIAVLGSGLFARGVTGHCRMYGRFGVSTASEEERLSATHALFVEKTLTVNAPVDILYRFWRDMENLPRFMLHVRSVQCFDDRRSHWIVNDPAGMLIEWDAEIITDVKNEHFSWQSAAYADVYNAGSVHFQAAPEGRGIEVKVVRRYTPPASAIGIAFATLLQKNFEQQLEDDLRRFKSLIETGEAPTTTGQPTGSSSLLGKLDVSDAIEVLH